MKGMTMADGIVVVIASVHRPRELGRWVDHIAQQTLKPNEMIWAVTSRADLPPERDFGEDLPGLRIIECPVGLTKQRNCALAAITGDPEFVAFFDDDYVPTSTCLEDIVRSFAQLPDVVGLTGTMLGDGINSSGIEFERACALIEAYESRGLRSNPPSLEPWDGLYGCNMAYRAEVIEGEKFDENLPLYAWQEDVDFAVRVARGRRMGRTDGFAGVHQGIKGGRSCGKRLGYSQIVNPLYLLRKGSMKRRKALGMATRNMIANHVRSAKPEPWVDRRGRVIGNWVALWDIVRGRVDPMRILEL
ncbi:glycosyltransferase family 2 protein [Novosphingobium profundi]|uniref:glycosyltransferase family 2 protein n=1 Tax=Novosphingobium profundi TaxID=1774954 RepID=UPI001BD9CDC6|nr:glycosyltransferase [Novosphingobium profundi]